MRRAPALCWGMRLRSVTQVIAALLLLLVSHPLSRRHVASYGGPSAITFAEGRTRYIVNLDAWTWDKVMMPWPTHLLPRDADLPLEAPTRPGTAADVTEVPRVFETPAPNPRHSEDGHRDRHSHASTALRYVVVRFDEEFPHGEAHDAFNLFGAVVANATVPPSRPPLSPGRRHLLPPIRWLNDTIVAEVRLRDIGENKNLPLLRRLGVVSSNPADDVNDQIPRIAIFDLSEQRCNNAVRDTGGHHPHNATGGPFQWLHEVRPKGDEGATRAETSSPRLAVPPPPPPLRWCVRWYNGDSWSAAGAPSKGSQRRKSSRRPTRAAPDDVAASPAATPETATPSDIVDDVRETGYDESLQRIERRYPRRTALALSRWFAEATGHWPGGGSLLPSHAWRRFASAVAAAPREVYLRLKTQWATGRGGGRQSCVDDAAPHPACLAESRALPGVTQFPSYVQAVVDRWLQLQAWARRPHLMAKEADHPQRPRGGATTSADVDDDELAALDAATSPMMRPSPPQRVDRLPSSGGPGSPQAEIVPCRDGSTTSTAAMYQDVLASLIVHVQAAASASDPQAVAADRQMADVSHFTLTTVADRTTHEPGEGEGGDDDREGGAFVAWRVVARWADQWYRERANGLRLLFEGPPAAAGSEATPEDAAAESSSIDQSPRPVTATTHAWVDRMLTVMQSFRIDLQPFVDE